MIYLKKRREKCLEDLGVVPEKEEGGGDLEGLLRSVYAQTVAKLFHIKGEYPVPLLDVQSVEHLW